LERRLWSTELIAPQTGEAGLFQLISQAYSCYQDAVVHQGWIYARFVDDFLSGVVHTDAIDAKSRNEHAKNVKTVEYLLKQRQDLVIEFFNGYALSEDDICRLIHLLNTTHPASEEDVPHSSDSALSLHSCLHKEEYRLLAECINRVGVFQERITTNTFISLLDGTLTTPLYSANNRLLSYLFNGLSKRSLIDNNWQSTLTRQNTIYTSRQEKFISQATLSSALYNITSIPPKERPSTFKDVEDTLDELKLMNDRKRNRFK